MIAPFLLPSASMRRVVEQLVAAVLEEPVFPPSILGNPRVVRGITVQAAPSL